MTLDSLPDGSTVPAGLFYFVRFPTVETVGYFQSPLRGREGFCGNCQGNEGQGNNERNSFPSYSFGNYSQMVATAIK